MDDEATRKLILRVQNEDLTSIWAAAAANEHDDIDSDVEMSLRVCSEELRAGEQQIDDRVVARAVALNDFRQDVMIRADGVEARRLFRKLNPDATLPESADSDRKSVVGDARLDTSSTEMKKEAYDTSRSTASLFGVARSALKRSADHLDSLSEPRSKIQASEAKQSTVSSRTSSILSLSARGRAHAQMLTACSAEDKKTGRIPSPQSKVAGSKRPAEDLDFSMHPAKRQATSKNGSRSASGQTQSASVTRWATPSGLGKQAKPTLTPNSFFRSGFNQSLQSKNLVFGHPEAEASSKKDVPEDATLGSSPAAATAINSPFSPGVPTGTTTAPSIIIPDQEPPEKNLKCCLSARIITVVNASVHFFRALAEMRPVGLPVAAGRSFRSRT
ncbi:hypothetical protein E4T39_03570 [Aureobasidium subglaciale]|nr:hypothetical protein E4T39_03570 [Aureobasidium subglaciale]